MSKWVDLNSFNAKIRKVKISNDDESQSSKLAIIVGKSHSIDIDEAIKFGFVRASEEYANAVLIASGSLENHVEHEVFLSDKQQFNLSELIRFAPGFSRNMITQTSPDTLIAVINKSVSIGSTIPVQDALPKQSLPSKPVVVDNNTVSTARNLDDKNVRVVKTKEAKAKILDAGVKIGRAKKDLYSKRTFTKDELGLMSASEIGKFIVKTKLWAYAPRLAKENGSNIHVVKYINDMRLYMPDFTSLKKVIDPEEFTLLCKFFADNFNENTLTKADLALSIIRFHAKPEINVIMKKLISGSYITRDFNRVHKFSDYLAEPVFRYDCQLYEKKRKANTERPLPSDLAYPSEEDIKLLAEMNLTSDFRILQFPSTCVYTPMPTDSEDIVAWKANRLNDAWGSVCKIRKKNTDKNGETGGKKPVVPERPHLALLKNDWLKSADVTPDMLIETFGFKGVEFGEWLPQDERQKVLNEAFAACRALADVTKLDDSMISLNGELSIAFGSRGKGRAAAHFEPDLFVFNLTRMNGAGSMAHEWAHALDYWLSGKKVSLFESVNGLIKDDVTIASIESSWESIKEKSTQFEDVAVYSSAIDLAKGFISRSSRPEKTIDELTSTISKLIEYSVSWVVNWEEKPVDGVSPSGRLAEIARGELMSAFGIKAKFSDLPDATRLNVFKFNPEANLTYQNYLVDPDCRYKHKHVSSNILSSLKQSPCFRYQSFAKKKNCFNYELLMYKAENAVRQFANYGLHPEKLKAIRSQSRYIDEAVKLDANRGAYYNTGKELFARAFESFVYDEIVSSERRCDYLVHSVSDGMFSGDSFKGNPYPAGKERQDINYAMRKMMELLSLRLNNRDTQSQKIKPPI